MLEQLPPKFKAIFFPFKENQKLFGVNKYRATTWRTQYRAGSSQFFATWTSLFFLGTSKHVLFATVFILFFRIPVFHARGRLPRKFGLERSIEKRKRGPNVEFCHINRPQKIQLWVLASKSQHTTCCNAQQHNSTLVQTHNKTHVQQQIRTGKVLCGSSTQQQLI